MYNILVLAADDITGKSLWIAKAVGEGLIVLERK